MANETVGVDINIKTNVAGSIGELKALKKQLKETAAGSDEFKKLTNQIDDLEDKLNKAKEELKNHKLKYFPELLDQPKRNYIPYEMLSDKFEVFENYLND